MVNLRLIVKLILIYLALFLILVNEFWIVWTCRLSYTGQSRSASPDPVRTDTGVWIRVCVQITQCWQVCTDHWGHRWEAYLKHQNSFLCVCSPRINHHVRMSLHVCVSKHPTRKFSVQIWVIRFVVGVMEEGCTVGQWGRIVASQQKSHRFDSFMF